MVRVPCYCCYCIVTNVVNLGDLVHLSALGQSIVIINSYEVANELLSKRAALYSDRPKSVLLSTMYIPPPFNYGILEINDCIPP